MKSVTVVAAVFNPATGFIEVAKEIINDDDTVEYSGQSFHPETLEWWAAVYDTDDLDELIDMVIHEPHVDSIEPMKMSAAEALLDQKTKIDSFKAAKKRSKALPRNTLLNSGLPQRFIDAAEQDAVQNIKDACHFDPEVLAIKREHVAKLRASGTAQQRATPSSRADALKLKLGRQEKTPRTASTTTPRSTTRTLPTIGLEGKRKKKQAE